MPDLDDAFAALITEEAGCTPTEADLRARVGRRRRNRRAGLGAIALVAIAAVAAGIAALGPDNKRTIDVTHPSPTTAPAAVGTTVGGLGWQVTVAPGWHAQHVTEWCNQPAESALVVSPDPHALSTAEHTAGCFQTPPPPGLVAISVVKIQNGEPVNLAIPSTPLPISLADLPVQIDQPAVREAEIRDHGLSFLLRVNTDPNASPATLATVEATLRSLRREPGLPAEPPLLGRAAGALSFVADGLAVDAAGNVYAGGYDRVVVIAGGRVTRVIGRGTAGFSGDGGPAADARLDLEGGGIALDDAGNLYIADRGNNRIRRVTPGGTITTFAGTGATASGPDGRPADRTALAYPSDVHWDRATQRLYVAEGSRVRSIGADGIVHTVAGTGKQEIGVEVHTGRLATDTPLCSPAGIAIATDRSLWIADSCDKSIARVAPDGHIWPAPGHAFRLAGAPDGSVSAYYGRSGSIDRVTPSGDAPLLQLDTQAPAASCTHYGGQGDDNAALTWTSGTLYFANPSMGRVCARDADGTIRTVIGG